MDDSSGIYKHQNRCESLYFYQKTNALYSITFFFVKKFLKYNDRTTDQMLQAARSGKQNIVEGTADGMTSSEMEIKLLNVARSSIRELREDYLDYLQVRQLAIWSSEQPEYQKMNEYCRTHNQPEDYTPWLETINDETMANLALTLCYMVDSLMLSYLEYLEKQFVTQGGVRERMTAARKQYKQQQAQVGYEHQQQITQITQEYQCLKERLSALEQQITQLIQENQCLKERISTLEQKVK